MRQGMLYVVIAVVVLAFSCAALALKRVQDQADRNQDAIAFICTTTTALDALVLDAKGSIERSFSNGTYKKLVQQGILTKEDVRRARATKNLYDAQHKLLAERGSRCTT